MLGRTSKNENLRVVTAVLAATTLLFATISSTSFAAFAANSDHAKLKALPKESLVDDGNSQLLRLDFKLQQGDFLQKIRISVDGTMIVEFDAAANVLANSSAFQLVFGSVTMLSDGYYAVGPAKGKFVIAMDKLVLGEGKHEAMAEVILAGQTLVANDTFVLKPSEPALPDLVAKFFFAPTTIKRPLSYWTFAIETNEGLDDAKQHDVTVYLSPDNTLAAGDKLGQRGMGHLEVGDFEIVSIPIHVQKHIAEGNQYLLVKVDSGNDVKEISEDNNVLSKAVNIISH